MIRNMRQDELRNLSYPNINNTNQNNNQNINQNNNTTQFSHNYRYQQRLEDIQSITDNIGIVYQDKNNKDEATQIENKIKYYNLRIYSQDRKWHLNTTDTFHNLTIYLGNSQTDKCKKYIQIPNTYQNVISIYSPIIIIPNLFTFQQEEIPPIIHLKINDITLTTTSNNSKNSKSQILYLSENMGENDKYIKYICMDKELLSIDTTDNSKVDFTSGVEISILNQYGNSIYQNMEDKINIKTITFNTDTNLIDIYFNNYLIPTVWKSNDKIIIKYYEFRETELDYEECYTWNNFINRLDGHKIRKIDYNLVNGTNMMKCNKISVDTPYIINKNTGEIETPEWFSNLLLKTNIDTLPKVNQEYKGCILNLDLQTLIQLQIQTVEKKIKNSN